MDVLGLYTNINVVAKDQSAPMRRREIERQRLKYIRKKEMLLGSENVSVLGQNLNGTTSTIFGTEEVSWIVE